MKQTDDMRTLALKSLQDLRSIVYKKILVEKSISEDNMMRIYDPIGEMDWADKHRYASALNTILKTSRTEYEIIMRAEEIVNEITQGK